MRCITIKKKHILRIIMLTVFAIIVLNISTVFGMQHYYTVDFTTGLVTATTLNVRSGPGTRYSVVATVKKNEYIRSFLKHAMGYWIGA